MAGAAAAALGAGLAGATRRPVYATELAPPPETFGSATVSARIVAAERPMALPCFDGHTLPLWTFAEDTWLPVIRCTVGDRLDVTLDNRLPRAGEHTSLHWHGIRLPNDQDGVPYLVQPPVEPGAEFRYSFVPPDTGTFFFHTHCNTVEQLGRGLTGVLIVDGDTTEPYAADAVLLLRDWLVDLDAGAFRAFTTRRGAQRAGTFGNVRSANAAAPAEVRLPASADCRLRLINADATRVMEIAIPGAEAAVIAIDGIAVAPFPLDGWLLPPSGRLDVVVRSPADGATAAVVDRRLDEAVTLARLTGMGPATTGGAFDPKPLRAGVVPEPDLRNAETLPFTFNSGDNLPVLLDDPIARLTLGSLCLSTNEYWTINGRSWPGQDHSKIPPPLAVLERGRSYCFRLVNKTPLMHPIHIHGHTFKVLGSDKRALPVHHSDTVLLVPEETVEVAFVADNPGAWMFHCHVIEHQEAGMMSYLQVT